MQLMASPKLSSPAPAPSRSRCRCWSVVVIPHYSAGWGARRCLRSQRSGSHPARRSRTHCVVVCCAADTQVALVRDGAAGAGVAPPALEALVQHVELTVDREAAARTIAHEAELSVKSVLAVPYVLIGTIAQIVEQLRDMRERWGVTRWVVRTDALDVAEQVLVALRS